MLSRRWKDINDKVKDPDSNIRKAYNYFIGKGYTPAQAAGIVGNLAQESSIALKSDAENSIGAFGIAQWLGPRRKKLEKFATDRNIDPSDFDMQLDFIVHELNTTEKRAHKYLLAASTPAEAATAFVNRFERSGEKPGDKGFDRRVNFANSFFDTFGDENLVEGKTGKKSDSNFNPLNVSADQNELGFIQDLMGVIDNLKTKVVSDKKIDAVKEALQSKIKQRNFLLDFINESGVGFVERKTPNIIVQNK